MSLPTAATLTSIGKEEWKMWPSFIPPQKIAQACYVMWKEKIKVSFAVFSLYKIRLPAVFCVTPLFEICNSRVCVCFQAPGGIATPLVYGQLLALYLLHNDM